MLLAIIKKKGEIKPTHLMYSSNLSHSLMNSYLEELIEKNLVKKIQRDNRDYFLITDKGYEFVQKLNEMREFERAFGL